MRYGIACCWVAVWATMVRAEPAPAIDFIHDIMPLIKSRCAECHTNGKYKGSLSMDTREGFLKAKAVVVGKSGESELIRRVTADGDDRMPPKGERLSAKQVALLRAWIDGGLPWQDGFTFKALTYLAPLKPRRPTLPPPTNGRNHPVDRILDNYFARNKVSPPPPLDDAAFVRRVYLDLIGLLPVPEEVKAFRSDVGLDKREKLVQRVLGDQRAYTEHWLSFWNDLLRNDYVGTGYIDGGRKQITAWLYRSLLENKPFDQFTRELIAPTPDSEGFINGIKWRGRVNASQVREVQFAQNVSQVFFGVNMKCASCHDSFIDTWKLDDSYGLAAIIADAPLEIHRCDKATGGFASPKFLWPELGTIDAKANKTQRLEQTARLVTSPDNGRFARTIVNRLWQRLMGRGIVHPVDVMANQPWSDDLLDYLAAYLVEQKFDLKKLLEHLVTSRAYGSRTVAVKDETAVGEYVYRGPELKRMTAEQFLDAVWMLTGTAPDKAIAPATIPAFAEGVPKERRFVRAALVKSDALMRSLGRPNREQVVTTRGDVLTTLQALDLSNGPIVSETLARGATKLLASKANSETLTRSLYLRALSREPSAEELTTALEIVGSTPTVEGVADLLWSLFLLPEFQFIR